MVYFIMFSATPALSAVSDMCVTAAQKAARSTGVPFDVLHAISLTETGREQNGVARPWPWTINVAGRGYWLDNQAEVLRHAEANLAAERKSFDLGCFQINYRWHSENFASLEQMLDPDTGAMYAARFLQSLYAETGNWSAAAGAYHSRTPQHATRYRTQFDQYYAGLKSGQAADVVQAPRVNAFPLLQSGRGQVRLGSLVPVFDGG